MSRAVGGATRRESDWGLEGSTDDWLVAAGLALDAARRQRLASSEGEAAPRSGGPGGPGGTSTGAASQAAESVTPPSPGAAPTPALDPGLSSVLAAATPPAPQAAPRRPTPASPTSGVAAPASDGILTPASSGTPNAPAVPEDRPRPMTLQPGFGQQPLIFEANQGQADPATPFLGRARDHALLLSPTQAVLALPPRPDDATGDRVSDTLRLEFVGANPDAVLRGTDELPSRSNYFRGGETPLQVTDVPNYGRVVAEGVYPGIDLVYRSTSLGQLEYDLVLGAGANPSAVQVAFHGAASMEVDDRGRLLLGMPGGQVVHESPVLYQEDAGGHRQDVSGRFTLLGDNLIGFQADAYDASRPLIIDPVLSYSQYVGGSDYDTANAVATDLAGNIYITGGTGSTDFSVLNPQQGSLGGDFDAFARKYSPSGTLLYSTYLGGSSSTDFSIGNEIAVDAAGNAYITGETEEGDYPVTSGAYDTSFSGTGQAAFLTKLSAAGNALVYSTFLGDDFTAAHGVAVDAQGQAVVAGFTDDNAFPTTVGAADTTFNSSGERDAFATKFRADGSGLVYSTLVGGDGVDSGFDVALDVVGNAYVTGYTSAATGGSLTPFPTVNAYQSSVAGSLDVFLTKINPLGTAYAYSTLLGGTGSDYATGVAIDELGQAYLTGQTRSSNWPLASPLDSTLGGTYDGFVTKFAASGSSLVYSSYLGGSTNGSVSDPDLEELGNAIVVDRSGAATIVGRTYATNFPLAAATQSTGAASSLEAFVTRVNPAGSALEFSTYLGGSGEDWGVDVALDLDGRTFAVGRTNSTDFPGASGAPSGYNGFLTAYLPDYAIPVVTAISTDSGSSATDRITNDQTLTISGTSAPSATITVYRANVGVLGTTTANGSGAWSFNYTGTTLPEGVHAFTATATAGGVTSLMSAPLLATVDLTAPAVSLATDAVTKSLKPRVRVTATDLNGLPNGTAVTLDVDLDNDGNFTDPGETAHTAGTLTDNVAILNLASALTVGATVRIRARVTDRAGNEGTSAAQSVAVISTGNGWAISDPLPTTDAMLATSPLHSGNLYLTHPLDLDQSPGTDVAGYPSLSYNSERVDVRPIIQATVQSDNGMALPSTITVQLTWNNSPTPQAAQTFNTTGLTPGDLLTVAQQLSSAVTVTGRYTWSLSVTMDYSPTPIVRTLTGVSFVVAEDASIFGAGWTLGSTDRLVDVPVQGSNAAGKLRVFGEGNWAFYKLSGSAYDSPSGDGGTLAVDGAGFKYTAPDGATWHYDSNGKLTKRVSADGFATITYTYSGSDPATIKTPDGATTTFAYASGKVETIKTGSRTVTLTHDSGNLKKVTNPDGGLHSFAYDGAHRLTQDEFANLSTTYAYDSSTHALSGWRPLGGGANSVTPVRPQGLAGPVGGEVEAILSDGLNRQTRFLLESEGQVAREVRPGGAVIARTFDAKGWLSTETDALTRTTTYTRDPQGYVTNEELPDGSTREYAYQSAFHALTTYTDERNNVTTYAYDGGGHRTRATDPLGNATVSTWVNGLLRTVTDARNHTTTYSYDGSRRLESIQDAGGGLFTYTYDGNGNVATTKDQLGRLTTFTNDALGRVLERKDAANGLWTMTYNGVGLLTSAKDALGRTTSNTFDGRGLLTKQVEAVGTAAARSVLFSYDDAGQMTARRDANGWTTNFGYDAEGRPQTTTDPLGGTSAADYDLAGQAVGGRDELGRVTQREYDSRGRVTEETDALGGLTSYAYDDAGNLTSMTDARGHVTSYSYDALNRQTAVTEALGVVAVVRTATVAYDAVGNVSSRTDWRGTVTSYSYDELNRQTAVTEALGVVGVARTATVAYDKVGNVTSQTDWRGTRTTYAYDALNRQTAVTEAVGVVGVTRTATVAYNAVGNVTSRTDWRGTQTTYAYDTLNRQTSMTEAVGTSVVRTSATAYDALGNVVAQTDPLGRTGVTVFDGRSQPVASRSPSGLLGRSQYDAAGNTQLSIDPRGNRTQAVPDALNRTLRVVDALGGVMTYLYDANGNRTGEINARGHRVTFGYDALNRQEARTDALNHTVTTVYDTAGNVRETIDQLGNRTTSSYDALNRRETVKEPLGGVVTTAYDAGSNVSYTLDQLGHKTTHVYDALGRETKTIDALNGVTSYLYDAAGNRTELIDPVGNRTTFAYDALNRLSEEKDPLGESVTYAYDAAGQLSSRTDRLGRRRDYGYDADGRQTSETWIASDGSTVVNRLTFTYDGNGNQLTAANAAGTYTMVYDALNRATSVQEPFSLTLTFAYDKVGNRTEVRDSTGGIGTFTYDAANRFTRQVFTSGGLVTLQFDLAYSNRDELGFITRYNANTGTNVRIGSSLYEYDANRQMTSIIHRDGPGTNLSFTINTFDAANRLWAERNALTNVRITFTYDNTDQLTGDGTRAYTYDANGNRTMSGYQTGSANRMSNDGTWTYSYDDEGNRVKKSQGASAETWQYGYDHRNQLVTAEQRATDGGTLLAKVTYTYDAWGYKVEESVWTSASGTTTVQRFGIDAWKTKQDGFGKDASYVGIEGADTWADLDGSNALVYRRLYTAEVDQPVVRVSAAGSMMWYLTDRQHTVGHLVDGGGTLVNTVTYDRYGGKLSESNATIGDRFAWQGQDYNAILGQYTMGVRQYDPGTGRFTSEDPSGFAGGDTHLARFGRNGPTNATDPSGLFLVVADGDEDMWLQLLGRQWGLAARAGLLSSGKWYLSVPKKELPGLAAIRKGPNVGGGTDWVWWNDELAKALTPGEGVHREGSYLPMNDIRSRATFPLRPVTISTREAKEIEAYEKGWAVLCRKPRFSG